MQDEPEAGECFQPKMSLKGELGWGCILLVDDHQYAERRAVDPGGDAGIGRGGPGGRMDRLGASSDLRFEAASLGGPAVGAAGQRRAGDRRAILGPTHRTEPGAAPPADRPVGPERANPGPSRAPGSSG